MSSQPKRDMWPPSVPRRHVAVNAMEMKSIKVHKTLGNSSDSQVRQKACRPRNGGQLISPMTSFVQTQLRMRVEP